MARSKLKHFRNRRQAGALLGASLREIEAVNPLVLGLLRGGVPVAYEAARALGAALDVFLVRKLGVPGQSELAFGAIADGDVQVLNQQVITQIGLDQDLIDRITRQQERELFRRARFYRGARPTAPIKGRTVFLIDDGMATGASMRAAILALSYQRPHSIVPAVPVAPAKSLAELQTHDLTIVDPHCRRRHVGPWRQCDYAAAAPSNLVRQAVALLTPSPFWGVGAWYDDFRQVSDAEVIKLLAAHARSDTAPP